ncbi:transposase [Streptomyces tubercidicus]|uniref:transposase n=1 Tax=Streptomyces tubercidicus TaxID=47759 RepID=UPI0022B77F38|nr:transposase [Streptomyces tubercidicus]WAU09992.1 transposase [Streptomyces tubercidicus]WAU16335.1 transposase [Streptomyces tubercidicus]
MLEPGPRPGPRFWTQCGSALRTTRPRSRRSAAGCRRAALAAGSWQDGDPHIVIVSDAGCDVTRLAWVLRDLPAELVGRVRSDRVMRLPEPPRMHGVNGRPPNTARNSASPVRRHGPSPRSARSRIPPLTARPRPGMGPDLPKAHP